MKNNFTLLILLFSITCFSQNPSTLFGTWEGKINVGVSLRIVFNFAKDSMGNIIGTCYSPDQGNKAIPCSFVTIRRDSLFVGIESLRATYAGKLINDSVIEGQLTQGRSVDLRLAKVIKATALLRPQTPRPPFPYISEDVEYENADKTLHYGATITIPKGKTTSPAVLLITGSGAQNRDEEIFGHKPFAVIADYLTRQGYVVLRVDDRGVGKSSSGLTEATTADFAKDVNTSLNYLKSRKEVNPKRLGMLGHSEGGMIAPMVASERKDIYFIILLAGPGEKISSLMVEQNVAVLQSTGLSKSTAEDYGKLFHNMIKAVLSTNTVEESKAAVNNEVNKWKINTPSNIVTATTGIINDSTQKQFVEAISTSLASPWFKYFLQFDPQPYLRKLHCKVLALNGEKDIQVPAKTNLAGISNALKKSGSTAYEVKEIPGLNHLFQMCKKCTVNEYGELEETISPEALKTVSNWLTSNIK